MRIAMIGQKGIPALAGGIERHVEELSGRLAKSGHSVFVYCRPWHDKTTRSVALSEAKGLSRMRNDTQCRPESRASGTKGLSRMRDRKKYNCVNLIYLPSIHTKHLDAISHTFLATIHALFQKYDIIHYHGVGPSLLAWLPRIFKPSAKVIATFHCIDRKHQKWGWFAQFALWLGEWAACKFPHRTIVVSKTLQKYCRKYYHCAPVYIPNGVALNFYNFTNKSNILQKYSLQPNKYLLFVSRLVRHKGAHYLIEAFKKIKKNDLKLVIVGDSVFTDDYVRFLKKLSAGQPKIIFTGFQNGPALAVLFKNALFVVHPSETEGMPITVLEAMAAGKTVLASDIPENRELTKTSFGYNFRNKDISDLAKKINFLIDSPHKLQTTGKMAQSFVKKYFNWENINHQVEDLYLSFRPPRLTLGVNSAESLP